MTTPQDQRLHDAAATFNKYGHAGKRLDTAPPSAADRLLNAILELGRRANSGEADYDGFGSGGYVEIRGPEDPERLTPLEAHMDRLLDHQRTNQDRQARGLNPVPINRDEVNEHWQLASSHFTEAAYHLRAAANAVELADTKTTPTKGPGQTQEECKQIHCHDNSAPGRKGNCEACYRYLSRKADAGIDINVVPADVIAERIEERRTGKRRKIHENGPLAAS